MKSRYGFLKVTAVLLAICAALAAFVFWKADPLNLTAPSDQRLLTVFHDHRVAFEQLRQMLTEDLRSAPVNSSGVQQLRASKSPHYQQLVSEIQPGLLVTINYDETVRFVFQIGEVFAIGPGWMKGIEYIPGDYKHEGDLLQNLDNARTLRQGAYLRQIEPHWFIVYQRDE